MGVLKEFSEKEKEYDMYRNRMRALSMLKSYENEINRLQQEKYSLEQEKHSWEDEKKELLRRLEKNNK